MKVTILYHDVVEPERSKTSGFQGITADVYKLSPAMFEDHLDALAQTSSRDWGVPFELTFDDGGTSALTCIAPALERRGWRGIFFVVGNRIGTPGFLDESGIRELYVRGHTIGSHSLTHPIKISGLVDSALFEEWHANRIILEDLLGVEICIGSIPGGFYSHRVARAAAAAGLHTLYTSEPTCEINIVDGCRIVGRFSVKRHTQAFVVKKLSNGSRYMMARYWVGWNLKKIFKAINSNAFRGIANRYHTRASTVL